MGLPLSVQTAAAQTHNAAAAMQLPADQKAYKAAMASPTPDGQIAALQAFVHDFPDSKRVGAARLKVLRLLLGVHPDRVRQIHALAKTMIHDSGAGIDRANEENEVSYELAEAMPSGIDLKSAEKWAADAVTQSTLPLYTAYLRHSYANYKIPAPSATEIQQSFEQTLAADLQTLADVYFHEGKLDAAAAALDRTKGFDPHAIEPELGAILLSRGQIADARHHDAEALDDLERAEVYGGLNAQGMSVLHRLYAQTHGGGTAGMDAEIDALYRKLIPAAFTPAPHTAPPTGRTVLLELYTGSGCAPCVGADLALDGVLQAYPRSEVVALSFDQHIPEPDPLANPETVARAGFYHIGGTPTAFIDGQSPGFVGGERSNSQKSFAALAADLDKQLNTPSGVTLKLEASAAPGHTVAVNATVRITDPETLHKLLATSDGKAPDAKMPRLVLNLALVQQDVRYSGENGIRFHSMVVRSLARPSAEGFPVAVTGESHASFSFDPAAVSAALGKYLAAYAQYNDRFGVVHFLSTDTSLTGPLAVAAWVEDPATHNVLQAAFVPLNATTQEAAR
ncbi:MAG TPA: hypothetical protein VHY48_01525 [Acidobacteriaceae bacterium]|jgi:tetratricopeptide (TPR) repeat protein|nr:hypothetical protein [Acidobacteriaceae bacterium]